MAVSKCLDHHLTTILMGFMLNTAMTGRSGLDVTILSLFNWERHCLGSPTYNHVFSDCTKLQWHWKKLVTTSPCTYDYCSVPLKIRALGRWHTFLTTAESWDCYLQSSQGISNKQSQWGKSNSLNDLVIHLITIAKKL